MMDMSIQATLASIIVSVGIIILMMQIAFWRNAAVSWAFTCFTLVASMLAAVPMAEVLPLQITPLLLADQYSLFFGLLILFATLICALLAKDYLEHRAGENEEFYLLLLLSALGGLILVSSTHLASFLLGLELLGVALYALIAYPERGHLPLEAATKYLILSGAASAILLFGFALIYAALGTLSFSGIGQQLSQPIADDNHTLILLGTAMVFTGIGFKLSLVPFHMWTPDVYHGAPSPVSGFLATVSKGAIFAALMRLFIDAKLYEYDNFLVGVSLLAIASMIIGNLLALSQNNLKRLLAYSSIAHMGYLFITIVIYGALLQPTLAIEAASFYLAAYVVTSLAAFALLSILSSSEHLAAHNTDVDTIDQLKGLFWQQPILALMLTIAMLSLAGIPLTAGFIGKFYLFTAGIKGDVWWLLGALVVGSGIGIYYYLRIVFTMTMQPIDKATPNMATPTSTVATFVVWLLIIMILYLGILPQPLMDYLGSLTI